MHYRDGRYYLSYSHGSWRHSSYSVHYATADTPTGPWTYRGAILASDATHKGPGHHSFIRSPLTGQWRIVYHRWENQTGDGPYRGSRQICIDAVEYDANGLIRPIMMTGQDRGAGGRNVHQSHQSRPGPVDEILSRQLLSHHDAGELHPDVEGADAGGVEDGPRHSRLAR